ncbi:MAG: glutaredoxin family protein [Gammaproteobacteria bacterium]|nr:glutaredoxin family protein [Gammaproteobacteria bacterium]
MPDIVTVRLTTASRPALVAAVALLLGWLLAAATPPPADGLEVFVRDGCPHCAEAERFLDGFGRRHPDLRVTYRDVGSDPAARADLERHSRAAGIWPPGVPTFVYEGRVLVGFDSAARTGPAIEALLGVEAVAEVHPMAAGPISVERLGLPLFTLALGLLDGFNPCAMWVLLFLLSLLVRLRDRRRMALVAGTFVAASGLVYFAFMAAWLNAFLLLGLSTPVRVVLGLVAFGIGAINIKDFWAFGRGVTLSIPAAARPGLQARMRAVLRADTLPASLAGVTVLAVVVNIVELLCTAGFPAVYTAVLAQQGLGMAAYYGYLGLYVVGYVVDDALMVTLAVIALSQRRLTQTAGRWLKLASGTVMLGLGALLLWRPDWLF